MRKIEYCISEDDRIAAALDLERHGYSVLVVDDNYTARRVHPRRLAFVRESLCPLTLAQTIQRVNASTCEQVDSLAEVRSCG